MWKVKKKNWDIWWDLFLLYMFFNAKIFFEEKIWVLLYGKWKGRNVIWGLKRNPNRNCGVGGGADGLEMADGVWRSLIGPRWFFFGGWGFQFCSSFGNLTRVARNIQSSERRRREREREREIGSQIAALLIPEANLWGRRRWIVGVTRMRGIDSPKR